MMKPNPKNSPVEPVEDTGEFACFDSLDALAAYVYAKHGEVALRELFTMLKDDGGPRETFEDCAAELEHRGLDKPAAVIYDIAQTAISGIDIVPDYMERAGPGFVDFWQERWLQRRKIKLGLWDQEQRDKAHQTKH